MQSSCSQRMLPCFILHGWWMDESHIKNNHNFVEFAKANIKFQFLPHFHQIWWFSCVAHFMNCTSNITIMCFYCYIVVTCCCWTLSTECTASELVDGACQANTMGESYVHNIQSISAAQTIRIAQPDRHHSISWFWFLLLFACFLGL